MAMDWGQHFRASVKTSGAIDQLRECSDIWTENSDVVSVVARAMIAIENDALWEAFDKNDLKLWLTWLDTTAVVKLK